ncbi:MAG: hypothetical protein DRP76_04935, partial [Candidatus Omnitrophota bacterium]
QLYQSPAQKVIIPLQDIFGWSNEHRINIPGKAEDQWVWRMPFSVEDLLNESRDEIKEANERLFRLTERSGRNPREKSFKEAEVQILATLPDVKNQVIQRRKVGKYFIIWAAVIGEPEDVVVRTNLPKSSKDKEKYVEFREVPMRLIKDFKGIKIYRCILKASRAGTYWFTIRVDGIWAGDFGQNGYLMAVGENIRRLPQESFRNSSSSLDEDSEEVEELTSEEKELVSWTIEDLALGLCGAEKVFSKERIGEEEFFVLDILPKFSISADLFFKTAKILEEEIPIIKEFKRFHIYYLPVKGKEGLKRRLTEEVFAWILNNNHPVLNKAVEGIQVREVVEYFFEPDEDKEEAFDNILKLINEEENIARINWAIEEMNRRLKMIENMRFENSLLREYKNKLKEVILRLPEEGKKELERIIREEKEIVEDVIRREKEGIITVFDLLKLHKKLKIYHLPEVLEKILSPFEKKEFFLKMKGILDKLKDRLAQRLYLASVGKIEELGVLTSKELLTYLTEYQLPKLKEKAEEAINEGDLSGFIKARDKLETLLESLPIRRKLQERDRAIYKKKLKSVLKEIGQKGENLRFIQEIKFEEIKEEVKKNPEKVFSVKITDVIRKENKVIGYIIEYKGLIGKVEISQAPKLKPDELINKEFPASYFSYRWRGSIIELKFSNKEGIWKEIEKAYKKEDLVRVKIVGIAHFKDGNFSGFKVIYKDTIEGFIPRKEAGIDFKFKALEPSSFIGREFNCKVISLKENKKEAIFSVPCIKQDFRKPSRRHLKREDFDFWKKSPEEEFPSSEKLLPKEEKPTTILDILKEKEGEQGFKELLKQLKRKCLEESKNNSSSSLKRKVIDKTSGRPSVTNES